MTVIKGKNSKEFVTPIQEFYSGQNVLITGGTGFLGKILLDKLLRSCTNLASIYILVRPKKGQNVLQRVEKILEDPIFQRLKDEVPKFRDKIVAVPGDCALTGLGISSDDRNLLSKKISIVFNVAATVRFDEKIQDAVAINIRGPRETLNLCREMPNLKAVVHVSTAYSNCNRSDIDEKFYESRISGDNIIELVQTTEEEKLIEITKTLMADFPNTYAYTKQIAEQIVQQYGRDLPTGVFRPAIVISTYKDPAVGWIDNVYGPTGALVGVGAGLVRTLNIDKKCIAELVPVDYTVNALIASAWDVANNKNEAADPPIYNYCSSWNNRITWGDYMDLSFEYGRKIPSLKSIWCYSITVSKNPLIYYILTVLLHILPALLFDIGLSLTLRKPRMLKIYKKIHKFSNVTSYFSTHMWEFTNNNTRKLWEKLTTEDKELFYFSMDNFDWRDYAKKSVLGLRIFSLKDDPSTIPQARKRMARFLILHKTIKWGTIGLFIWTLYLFLLFIWTPRTFSLASAIDENIVIR